MKSPMCNNKGESLIETIVSMIMFGIYMIAITGIINTALGITRTSTKNAETVQKTIINPAILEENYDFTGTVTFSGGGISASHTINIYDDSGIIAFMPE